MVKNRKCSHREMLSADAKLIVALLRKQPQTREELIQSAGIDVSTFYRNIPLLKWREIVKETQKGNYALWTYIELEKAVENVLDKLDSNYITFNKIASEVGVHPFEIESILYKIAKKCGLEVRVEKGEKVVGRPSEGLVLF